jgi:AcrR family transcriptional regulator
MAEVARRLGVSEPVIFQNFGSKAAVFAAVVEDATGQLTAAMRERAVAHRSIGAWLAELLSPDQRHEVHARHSQDVLFADAVPHGVESPVTEAIRGAHHALAQTLAELLARGRADDSVREDLDPEVGAW